MALHSTAINCLKFKNSPYWRECKKRQLKVQCNNENNNTLNLEVTIMKLHLGSYTYQSLYYSSASLHRWESKSGFELLLNLLFFILAFEVAIQNG